MILSHNPYQFSNPVYRSGEFFNRDSVIARLQGAIYAERSVQLVGQFRLGKSSVLRYVHTHSADFFKDHRMITVYYDLSRRPLLRNGNDFFARLWQMMSLALVERGQHEAALKQSIDLADPFEFDSYLEQWIKREGYRFVFLLDEFGLVASNEKFDRDFFDNLRSTIPTLTYVLAAPRSLSEFTHPGAVSSPLWGVLQLIQLKLFEDRAAIFELVHKPAEQVGFLWSDAAESFIYERGGQHPCYIQMAASALYETRLSNQGQPNYEQADRIFRETAAEHFRYICSKTLVDRDRPDRKEQLQTALLDLVHGRKIDTDLAEDLENHGLVWHDKFADEWKPLSAWFADWLRRWSTDKRNQADAEIVTGSPQPESVVSAGQLLGDQYQILKTLHRTHHSQIMLAWDRELERLVAVKLLRPDQESNYEAIQRLRENLKREGRIIAGLKHSNIGQVYAVISDPLGIVMEWLDGSSLQDILDSGGKLSLRSIIEIGIALSDALNYVHRQQVFHRDIKPGNIILVMNSRTILKPVLVDFDVARAVNCETMSLQADGSFGHVGTPSYNAPEQFLNPEGIGPYTDLFALGLVLYRLLTGKAPYALGNLPSVYPGGDLPQPDRADIPEFLYQVLCLLLRQKPGDRPDAVELKEKLIACLAPMTSGDSF